MKKKAKRVSIYDFEEVGPCDGCGKLCNHCGRNSTPVLTENQIRGLLATVSGHAALISQLNKSCVELIVENKKLKDEISRHPEKNMIEALVKENKKLKGQIQWLKGAIEDCDTENKRIRRLI